jgi:hypothetical protein
MIKFKTFSKIVSEEVHFTVAATEACKIIVGDGKIKMGS